MSPAGGLNPRGVGVASGSNVQGPKDDGQVLERDQQKVKEPEMYKVILLNDDYTTMEFVVEVIVQVFKKDIPTATKIMLDVHRRGAGVVGSFTYDIAMSKAEEVHKRAKAKNFPLRCRVEKD